MRLRVRQRQHSHQHSIPYTIQWILLSYMLALYRRREPSCAVIIYKIVFQYLHWHELGSRILQYPRSGEYLRVGTSLARLHRARNTIWMPCEYTIWFNKIRENLIPCKRDLSPLFRLWENMGHYIFQHWHHTSHLIPLRLFTHGTAHRRGRR